MPMLFESIKKIYIVICYINMVLYIFRFDSQHIVMENILLFISNKYIECVNSIKEFIKSGNVFHLIFF